MKKCCNIDNSIVKDSRKLKDRIKRRRECKTCGSRFSTWEVIDEEDIDEEDITPFNCKCGNAPFISRSMFGDIITCNNCDLTMKGKMQNGGKFNIELIKRWNKLMSDDK